MMLGAIVQACQDQSGNDVISWAGFVLFISLYIGLFCLALFKR